MSNKSGTVSKIMSRPKGGGVLHEMGASFARDLHTGIGIFTDPIPLPADHNGFQRELSLDLQGRRWRSAMVLDLWGEKKCSDTVDDLC